MTRILAMPAFAALILAATAADAVTVPRTELTVAAAACQPAMGAFHAQIRARPVLMGNEGSSSAFVTCGLRSVRGDVRYIRGASVYLRNEAGAARTVQCTLVDAGPRLASPTYLTKSLTLAAGQDPTELGWQASDNGDLRFRYPAISCALPPGTGISGVVRRFDEEVGQ